jgi:hypothetical protein
MPLGRKVVAAVHGRWFGGEKRFPVALVTPAI